MARIDVPLAAAVQIALACGDALDERSTLAPTIARLRPASGHRRVRTTPLDLRGGPILPLRLGASESRIANLLATAVDGAGATARGAVYSRLARGDAGWAEISQHRRQWHDTHHPRTGDFAAVMQPGAYASSAAAVRARAPRPFRVRAQVAERLEFIVEGGSPGDDTWAAGRMPWSVDLITESGWQPLRDVDVSGASGRTNTRRMTLSVTSGEALVRIGAAALRGCWICVRSVHRGVLFQIPALDSPAGSDRVWATDHDPDDAYLTARHGILVAADLDQCVDASRRFAWSVPTLETRFVDALLQRINLEQELR